MRFMFLFAAACAIQLAAAESFRMSVEIVSTDGTKARETFEVPIVGHEAVFAYPRQKIGPKTKEVNFKPDFATARKGEEGYFVMPSGGGCLGHFTRESGSMHDRRNWFPITAHGMKTPRKTFVALPTGMRWNFSCCVGVRSGVYEMWTSFDIDIAHAYEDPAVKYIFLSGDDANYSGMGRAVRRERLAAGEMKPIRERMKTNAALAYSVGTPIVRIRQAWKSREVKLPEQNIYDEPPVDVYCSFARVKEFARRLKANGVEKADICLVGWNYKGHDGRYPQVFPVEPTLGGEAGLRDMLAYVQGELGYPVVGHVNYRDAYLIADCFDWEYCLDRKMDGTRTDKKLEAWSGGAVYRVCPRRAYERFALKHTAMMKSLGFRGIGYLDVTTSRPLLSCDDPRHPLDMSESRRWELAILDLQAAAFGSVASEGGYDWAIGHIDYGLTISYSPPFNDGPKKWNALVDERIPFWQIAYHGVVMSGPFRTTWNVTANPDRRFALKEVEFGGRPIFYVYGGWNRPGAVDIKCRTDEELDAAVRAIKAGVDAYAKRAALETEYMDRHDRVADGVYRTTYSNGVSTYVNYGKNAATVDGVTVPALDWIVK